MSSTGPIGYPIYPDKEFRTPLALSMLSIPTASNLQRRQQHHRRQNSTPTAFEAPKIPLHPANIQPYGPHRRGMSLDQINLQHRPRTPQDHTTVCITNPGQHQQHTLQVAQQQRQAQPGQQQDYEYQQEQSQSLPIRSEQEYREQQHRALDAQLDVIYRTNVQAYLANQCDGASFGALMQQNTGRPVSLLPSTPQDALSFPPHPPVQNFGLGFVQDVEAEPSRPMSSDGGHERKMPLQPDWTIQQQRPITPPNQSSPNYFPVTPEATPYEIARCADMLLRYADPTSPAWSQPHGQQFGPGYADMTYTPSCQIKQEPIPSPPHTAPLAPTETFDVAPMPATASLADVPIIHLEPTVCDQGYDSSYYSPQSVAPSSGRSSEPSSPELGYMAFLDNPSSAVPKLVSPVGRALLPANEGLSDYRLYSPFKAPLSPRSVSVMEEGLDASIAETGISIEQVQMYISEQDPVDQKWTCQYPDCRKKFGRKENIKSHVQTHLGDRQFVCNVCKKDFVRQHDLKRHFKIHKGNKDYLCKCGSGFARHDALTRHRQRGFCEGAFEGIVKKPVKRGRPRKERPEMDERREKAAKTRQRLLEKAYCSSASGTTDSSSAGSPAPDQEKLELGGISIEDNAAPFKEESALETSTASLPPEIFSYTPPLSPGYSTGTLRSPDLFAQLEAAVADSPCPLPVDEKMSMVVEEAQYMYHDEGFTGSNSSTHSGNIPELIHSSPPAGLFTYRDEDFTGSSSNVNGDHIVDLSHSSPPAAQFADFATLVGEEQTQHDSMDQVDGEASGDFSLMDMNDKVEDMFMNGFGDSMSTFEPSEALAFSSKIDFDSDDLFSGQLGSSHSFFDTP